MRNLLIILLTLFFSAAFPASKTIANTHKTAERSCFSSMISSTQTEFIINKFDKSTLKICQNDGIDKEDLDKEECNSKKENTPFHSITESNLLLYRIVKIMCLNVHYGNPYDNIGQLPIYILNHALLIPFS